MDWTLHMLNKCTKFGAKNFRSYWVITFLMLRHFLKPHPVVLSLRQMIHCSLQTNTNKKAVLRQENDAVLKVDTYRNFQLHRAVLRLDTSRIISRLISLRFLLGLTPTSAIWSNGNTPKIVVDVRAESLEYLWNGARWDQGYYDPLIGSHIRAFVSYQNQWPWMTLNSRYALLLGHILHCFLHPIHIPRFDHNFGWTQTDGRLTVA